MYLAGIALAAGTLSYVLLNRLLSAAETAVGTLQSRRRREHFLSSLPEAIRRAVEQKHKPHQPGWLEGWNQYASGRLAKTGWKISSYALFNLMVILAIAGITTGAILFRNIAISTVIAMCLASLPVQLLNWAVQKYDKKLVEQVPLAIQMFVAEFQAVKNLREALERTARSTGDPLRKHLEQCVRDLATGKRPYEAFRGLAESVDNDYVRVWAQMLIAASEDQTVVRTMPQLAVRVSSQKMLEYKNAAELSGERKVGILLNLLVFPGFIAVQLLFPDSRGFFSTTLGKLVVMTMFVSVSVGIALDLLLRRVEV